jgi:fatty-acyl-CoA synthase
VAAAGAVGRPDRTSGEVPVAFVALSAPGITVEELTAWVAEHISEPAARPKSITVLDAIPVTEIGKPFKPALREAAAARHFRAELAEHGIDGVEVGVRYEAGRLVVRLTGGAGADAAAVLRGYNVEIRMDTEEAEQ